MRMNKNARWSLWLVVFASFVLLASACSDGADSSESTTTGATQTTSGGDADQQTTLVAAIGEGDPMQWDPELDNEKASIHFGDNLVWVDSTGELVPGLAESWSVTPDGTEWTFTLRPDVPFHGDWGTVTAEDVKFTWSEWTNEGADHGRWTAQMRQAVDDDMDNFEIVSDLEFKLHTTRPVADLVHVLSAQNTGMTVTSARYFADTDPEIANTHPIGTGPWQFVSSNPGVEMVLEAFSTPDNPHPFRATPAYDRLILQIIPDAAARLAQVRSGAIDVAELGSQLVGEANAAEMTIVSNLDIGHADVLLGGMYFGDEALDQESPWIQGDSPDSEAGRAVREALSLAIDRQLILDRILYGQGALSYAPLYQYNRMAFTVDKAWTELPAYDPELARQRLADGGYPDGFELEMFLFGQDVDTVALGEAVAGMWEEIGITVNRTPVEEDLVDERLANKDTDGKAWVNINGYYLNPNPTFANYRNDPDLGDWKFFHPAINEGYELATVDTTFEGRWETGISVLNQLMEDFMPINLMSVNMPFVLSENVASFSPFPGVNTINSLETVQPKG